MLEVGKKRTLFSALPGLCVFLGFFLFILLYIDPPAIYSSNGFDLYGWVRTVHNEGQSSQSSPYLTVGTQPIYNLELTRLFFRQTFSSPGGFTSLLVSAVIAACHIPFLGAVAILLIALLLFWAFPRYVKNSGGPDLLINRWIPVILIVISCCRYDLFWFGFFIPIAGALTLAIVYQRTGGSAARVAALIALSLLAYYLFQWAALLFLVLVLMHEGLTRPRRMVLPVVAAVVAVALFCLLENRLIAVDNCIRWKVFITPPLPPWMLVAYFPLIALGVRLLPREISPRGAMIRVALLVVIAATAISGSITDPVLHDTRAVGHTMNHMLNRQWAPLIEEDAASLLQQKTPVLLQVFMVNIVDRALYETGRLGDDMFSFPQSQYFQESLLLLQSTLVSGFANWAAALDLYMDLGAANIAEKVAGETMENMGPYPFLLERRALIQAAKGNSEAAAVYLNRLSGMPFYHREAERLLSMIRNGTIMQDARVGNLAACKDTADYLLYHPSIETILTNLSNRNPRNRMAWEYLISYYLQTGQPSRIVGEIGRYREFGYSRLPADWDQALCISLREDTSLHAESMPVLPQQETVAGYDRFLRACGMYRDSQPAAAVAALQPSYGSSYFFCYVFGFAPGSMR